MNKRLFLIGFYVFCCVTLFSQHAEWRDYIENKQFKKLISEIGDL